MSRKFLVTAIACMAFFGATTSAVAASGDLDLTFGDGDGINIERPINTSSPTATVAVRTKLLSDGSIVLTGRVRDNIYVTKFLSSGPQDTSFGTNGLYELDVAGGSYDEPRGLVVQSDGKLLIAGRGGSDAVLIRLTANGQPDPTFSGDGIQTMAPPALSSMEFSSVELQSGGEILVTSPSLGDGLIARYTTAGVLDDTFGGDGIVNITGEAFGSEMKAVVDSFEDRIIIGSSNSGNGYKLARFTSSGALDTVMYSGADAAPGFVDFGSTAGTFVDMDIDTIGAVGIVGSNAGGAVIIRVDQNGSLDSNFNTTGVASFDPTGDTESPSSIEADGSSFLIAGRQDPDGGFIARFTGAGVLDDDDYETANHGYVKTTCAENGTNPVCGIDDLDADIDGSVSWAAASTNVNGDSTVDIGSNDSVGGPLGLFDGDGKRHFVILAPDVVSVYDSSPGTGDRTLVAGIAGPYNNEQTVLAMFNPDGTLDANFAGDGSVEHDFYPGTNDYLQGASVDANGNTFVYGWKFGAPDNEIFIGKFDSTGAIDTSFGGGDGLLEVDVDPGSEFPTGLLPLPNGNLLVSGFVIEASTDRSPFLVELQQSGTIAPLFNSGATQVVPFAGTSSLQVGKPLHDGSGTVMLPLINDNELAAVRFEADGDLDPTFGTAGIASFPSIGNVEQSYGQPTGVMVGDDYVVTASTSGNPTGVDPFIAKIDQAGVLDPTFGTAGFSDMTLSAVGNEGAPDIAVDALGRFTISTTTDATTSPNLEFVTGRVLANGAPDPTYGSGILRVTTLPSGFAANGAVGLVSEANRMLVFGGVTELSTSRSYFSAHAMQIENPIVPPTTPPTLPTEPGPTPPSAACLTAKKKLAALRKLLKKQKKAAKKAKTAKKKKSTRKAVKKTTKKITAAKKTVKKACA